MNIWRQYRKQAFWAFVVIAALQAAVPLGMIARREVVLATGQSYKFRTAPVDPTDAFRGKYVALAFQQQSAVLPAGVVLERGQPAYALLERDDQGFARIRALSVTEPRDQDCLRVTVDRLAGAVAHFTLPFDRFYLEESQARAAEDLYREHSRTGSADAWAVVRIRGGAGVIEDLFLGGEPIRDAIRKARAAP